MNKIFLLFYLILFSKLIHAQCWKDISTGDYHSIAIKMDGTLWAWGNNGSGQIGDGTTTGRSFPIQVGTANNWKKVEAGYNHSFAIKMDGTLWAWGENAYAQLGNGSTTESHTPIQIGSDNNWSKISSSRMHTVALKTNGTLWAWGTNDSGQIGDGTNITRLAPIQIGNSTNWKEIHTLWWHNLAIKTDGTLWTWGWNEYGQLGDNTKTKKSSPIQIGTATNWDKIQAGYYHSLALRTDGTLWTWGNNYFYQLGDGTQLDKKIPIQVGSSANSIDIYSGFYSSFAIKSDKTLWGWGSNNLSIILDTAASDFQVPIKIKTENHWDKIAVGEESALKLTIDGKLFSHGNNSYGVLGRKMPGLWSDTIYTSTCNTNYREFALLSLNLGTFSIGQILTITGSNFPPNFSDTVLTKNAKGQVMFKIPFTANNTGGFTINRTIGATESGIYSVSAYDTIQKKYTAVVKYEVKTNTPNPLNKYLYITSPDLQRNYDLANNTMVSLEWTDKIYSTANIIGKTAQSRKTYIIEYTLNGGAWQLATIQNNVLTAGLINTWKTFKYQFNLVTVGSYQFRIKEQDNSNNWDTSYRLTVTRNADPNVTISKEWDNSWSLHSKPINKICADGTARFYYKIKKKTNQAINISKVKLTATDPQTGSQDIAYVGKIQATNNLGVYDTSGNTANSNTAINTTLGSDNSMWFWYVAPDNFARNSGDDYKGERKIQVDFEITYSDNSIDNYSQSLYIVRPPIMFVHGLGGDEQTWDNFAYSKGAYEPLFIQSYDIFQAGIHKPNMYPSSSFDQNARMLLAIDGLFSNSIQSVIENARKNGFVSNKVDYVAHSMGGSIIRYGIDKYREEYFSTYNALKWRNYNKGFTNKLITLNTPHNGSVFADHLNTVITQFTFIERYEVFNLASLANKVNKLYTFIEDPYKILNHLIPQKQYLIYNHLILTQ